MVGSFIRKDGARIEFTANLPDTVKDKYSEVAGRKLVNERLTLTALETLTTVGLVNLIYVNPCEPKLLQCFALLSDTSLASGRLDIMSDAELIASHDFELAPLTSKVPLAVEVDPHTRIGSGNAVWVTGSGDATLAVTLEVHEHYRWVE